MTLPPKPTTPGLWKYCPTRKQWQRQYYDEHYNLKCSWCGEIHIEEE